MKNIILFCLLFSFVVTLTSCDLIEGIFKAGIWIGVIGVLIVIGLVLWIVRKLK